VQLAPDFIKLDMSLVRGINSDPALWALVTAMTFFAGETGAVVVAEGVETDAELKTLQRLGVHRGRATCSADPRRCLPVPRRRS
jgi:EAL domain-containing protein (putative c-di-GMP-specific phosphodiesterase class I)